MKGDSASSALLLGVWSIAAVGIVLKIVAPGRYDRVSIALYLLLGWSGLMAYQSVFTALPDSTVVLLVVGGFLYSAGVVFHLWERLRFQNAIWHVFVLAAATCHYTAVLDCLAFART